MQILITTLPFAGLYGSPLSFLGLCYEDGY
jgi:hypothetical protein